MVMLFSVYQNERWIDRSIDRSMAQVEAGDEAKREEQLAAYFELKAIQMGEEGLVVKTLDGHYEVRIPAALCDTFFSNDQVGTRRKESSYICVYMYLYTVLAFP